MARRFTYEEVKYYIEMGSGSGCKLLSKEYIDSVSKIKIQCKCGEVFITDFNQFKNMGKQQCNKCGWMNRDKSNSYNFNFVKEYIKKNTNFTLVSTEYKGCKSKLKLICNKCGDIYYQTFDNIKNGNLNNCPNCARKEAGKQRRLGYKNIKEFIKNNSDCTLLTTNKDILVTDKIILKCACGNEFTTTFASFKNKNKRQCNDCGNKIKGSYKAKTHSDFVNEVENVTNNEYTVVGRYKNSKTKIKMRHNKCGHEWNVLPNGFLGGSRCPVCNGGIAYSHEQYCNKMFELVGNEYSPIEKYKGGHVPIKIKHNKCGYKWKIRPSNFFHGTRCPQCNESKGEEKIRIYLENQDIKHEQEYAFDGLIGINEGLLRFDFAVFNNNYTLKFLIEYDGVFHYEKQYDEDGFNTLQIHDKRKNQYCRDNNIPLLRIPYWEFDNVEQILKEWLSKYGLIHKNERTA